MAPLKEGDTEEPLKRDEARGWLLPTKVTAALRRYCFSIRKGSVADRFFNLGALDACPSDLIRSGAKVTGRVSLPVRSIRLANL